VGTALAVDIGGTKLAAGLVTSRGDVIEARQVRTPGSGVFEAVVDLVAPFVARASSCGVGCGGPMTPGGEEVSPLNIPSWRGFPLRARLGSAVGMPVMVDNDAKALALGEGWVGAAAGERDYLAMVVSTGVGGGLVVDGRLLDGATGNAGHIGHVIVEPEGRVCGCGARGCLEAETSGTAIAAETGAPAEEAGPAVVERTGRLVGRAVASVCNLLDVRLAVVGGSVALGFGGPFFAAAQAEVDASCRLDFSRGARVVPAALGPYGGLVGAARLAFSRLEDITGA
jgi:glucokinase